MRRLALNQKERLLVWSGYHHVDATSAGGVRRKVGKMHLSPNEVWRKTKVVLQVGEQLLPDSLLGCRWDQNLPTRVEENRPACAE